MNNSGHLSFSVGKGFTLVEMMVVIVILGVLAAIAFPSYQASIEKTNMATAKQEMISIRQTLAKEKVSSPSSYKKSADYNDFLNRMTKNAPKGLAEKYELKGTVVGEGGPNSKIFSIVLQAVPKNPNYKFGLWMDRYGYVFKCPKSVVTSTIQTARNRQCEPF